jgi:DnaJ-class molecular chaperone
VTLSIPPGTDSGTRLRLSGKGVPDPRGGRPGDLLARIQIRVPRNLDEQTRASFDGLSRFEDPEIRKEFFQ